MDKFFEQLPHRIPKVRPSPEQQDFALYVRLVREKKGMDREQLGRRVGIEPHFLSLLENHLLFPEELTGEIRSKIERTFGISCTAFKRLNASIMDELRQEWGYNYTPFPNGHNE